MNLVEKLMKADVKKAEELEVKVIKSKRLGKILGSDESVEITIQEIPSKRLNEILSFQFDKKGQFDMSKSFDAKALSCVEGIIEPNVRDEALREHFNCATPKDLVVKLFGNEITKISDGIVGISGLDDQAEEEIKN